MGINLILMFGELVVNCLSDGSWNDVMWAAWQLV